MVNAIILAGGQGIKGLEESGSKGIISHQWKDDD